MHYVINVSLNGRHLFATDKHSITNERALKEVYGVFKEKFPVSEGYCMIVWKSETFGKFIDMEEVMENE